MIDTYRHFDRLFQASTELSGTFRTSVRRYEASSSIITAFLIATREHYLAILAVYGGIVGAAQETIQLYKTIADLKASEVPAEVVKSVEARKDSVRDAYLDEFFEDIMSRLGQQLEESRRKELRNELKPSSRIVIGGVINGARVSLSIENFSGSNLKDMKFDDEPAKTVILKFQQIRQLENSIERVKSTNPEMIKAITAQNNDQS